MAAKKKDYLEYTPEEHTWSDEVKNAERDHNYWNGQQLQDFTYDDFSHSQQTTDYLNQLNGLKGPGQFQFTQQQGWQNVIDQIMNREKFSYDVNGDALYQQYKDQYVNQGKMAMMDTMGQAAAMTGGYGNSYAQSVGQQAYQGHLQQLTDKIPELYSLALDKYNSEGQDLYNKYGLYSDQYNVEYGQHRDAVADYQADRSHLASMVAQSHGMDVDKYNTNRDTHAAEVESHNSNISHMQNYTWDVYNSLKNTEWGQHMDSETLKKLAIDVANDKLYKQEQTRIADEELSLAQDKWDTEKKLYGTGGGSNPSEFYDNPATDDDEDETDPFTGATYEQAAQYIMKHGASTNGMIPEFEFNVRKRADGKVYFGGKAFSTYGDYLKAYCEYAVSNK